MYARPVLGIRASGLNKTGTVLVKIGRRDLLGDKKPQRQERGK